MFRVVRADLDRGIEGVSIPLSVERRILFVVEFVPERSNVWVIDEGRRRWHDHLNGPPKRQLHLRPIVLERETQFFSMRDIFEWTPTRTAEVNGEAVGGGNSFAIHDASTTRWVGTLVH